MNSCPRAQWLVLAEYITIPFVWCCAFTTLVYGTRFTKGNGVVWQVVNHFNCAIFLFTQINIKMLLFSTHTKKIVIAI